MKIETKLALAAALIALAAELSEDSNAAPAATPTPTGDTPQPATEKTRRGRKPNAEEPAAPITTTTAPAETEKPKAEETSAPAEEKKPEAATRTIEDMRALFRPLVEAGKIAMVKEAMGKYAPSLVQMNPTDYPAFEKDIAALDAANYAAFLKTRQPADSADSL